MVEPWLTDQCLRLQSWCGPLYPQPDATQLSVGLSSSFWAVVVIVRRRGLLVGHPESIVNRPVEPSFLNSDHTPRLGRKSWKWIAFSRVVLRPAPSDTASHVLWHDGRRPVVASG